MNVGVKEIIASVLHCSLESISFSSVGGGSINQTYRISKAGDLFFCKINSAQQFPLLFEKEKNGLEAIGKLDIIRVPKVYHLIETDEVQVLIMENIEEGKRSSGFWDTFGQQLASLHDIGQPQFGFQEDNYMGALPQSNTWTNDWPTFFINNRLKPQVDRAYASTLLTENELALFENLYEKIPSLLSSESPSLLHGDLWSGNFLCDSHENPVLIDPAVYYGDRNMDLAMTTLFGGFEKEFYDSYQYHSKSRLNENGIWQICNLYPLLIHLNLFGRAYLSSILSTLRQF